MQGLAVAVICEDLSVYFCNSGQIDSLDQTSVLTVAEKVSCGAISNDLIAVGIQTGLRGSQVRTGKILFLSCPEMLKIGFQASSMSYTFIVPYKVELFLQPSQLDFGAKFCRGASFCSTPDLTLAKCFTRTSRPNRKAKILCEDNLLCKERSACQSSAIFKLGFPKARLLTQVGELFPDICPS